MQMNLKKITATKQHIVGAEVTAEWRHVLV